MLSQELSTISNNFTALGGVLLVAIAMCFISIAVARLTAGFFGFRSILHRLFIQNYVTEVVAQKTETNPLGNENEYSSSTLTPNRVKLIFKIIQKEKTAQYSTLVALLEEVFSHRLLDRPADKVIASISNTLSATIEGPEPDFRILYLFSKKTLPLELDWFCVNARNGLTSYAAVGREGFDEPEVKDPKGSDEHVIKKWIFLRQALAAEFHHSIEELFAKLSTEGERWTLGGMMIFNAIFAMGVFGLSMKMTDTVELGSLFLLGFLTVVVTPLVRDSLKVFDRFLQR